MELELNDEEVPLLIDVIDAFRNVIENMKNRCSRRGYNLVLGAREVMF